MANVLLGVTGSVAAIKTPLLYAALRQAGHAVRVVATPSSLYFFDPADLTPPRRDPEVVTLDADEWPGREDGRRWQRSDPVLHITLRRWAHLLLIAPLDANTLAKLANGLADNCLTCVWRAWEPGRPVVLAPAMNTLMWQHPLTARHLRQLAECEGITPPPELTADLLPAWINIYSRQMHVVPPISKVLACGDEGVGALASPEEVVAAVQAMLDRKAG